jgi:hypothetical protein
MTDQKLQDLMRAVNDAIGQEAFDRLEQLDLDTLCDFETLLASGNVALHHDGYLGFTTEMSDSSWTNECFELPE